MKSLIFALAFILFALPAHAGVVTKEITYKDGDVELQGYFAYDDTAEGLRPGVIVVHEWWGFGEYAKKRAEMLAGLGYAALAIDMYGKGKFAENPDEAKKLSAPFYENRALMETRAQAGLAALKAQTQQVDPNRLAAVGYCFGGTVVLELARRGEDLKGVVSFHGGLATPERAEPGRVKAQVLALNGGDDPMVKQEEKDNFVAEMKAAGANFKNIDYPGATHAFTNPKATEIGERFKLPVAYNEAADKKSWEEMEKFLERLFVK